MKELEETSQRQQESRQKEYLMLREESQSCFKRQQEWSTFSITAVITLLGIALNLDQQIPEFYLLPYIVLIIAAVKVHNLRESILRIASYMISFHECKGSFYWETTLNVFRSNYNKEIEKHPLRRLIDFFETQEFTFMALVCLLLFVKTALVGGSFIHVLHVIELMVALSALCFIGLVSRSYFTFNPKEIEDYAKRWKNLNL